MKKVKHNKTFRHIILMWFVLFSLSPCTVKDALFHFIHTDYAKPLNKVKAQAPVNSCSYPHYEFQQSSSVNQSRFKNQITPVYYFKNYLYDELNDIVYHYHSKTSSGNSPPKYILFKRLKIHLA